jgi:predicted alpha/beta-hydrolase family hydrolase
MTLALLLAPRIAAAQPGFPPDNPDSWRVAGTAKVLCSAVFVSGRDPAEARRNVSAYFLGNKLDSITAFDVDRSRRTVMLTF